MTLTAINTVGFEKAYNKGGFPSNAISFDGSTGTTYTMGQLCAISNGLVASITGASTVNAALPIAGIIAETKVTTDADKTVKVIQSKDEVFTVSFDGHTDFTATGSTADNMIKLATASTVTHVGKLVHVYEGPSKGDTKVVTASSTSDSTLTLTVSGAFSQRPTTATKAIMSDLKPGQFLRVSTAAAGKVSSVARTAGLGYVVVQSVDPANLRVDVVIAPNKQITGIGQTAT